MLTQRSFASKAKERNQKLDMLVIRWIGRINMLSSMEDASIPIAKRIKQAKRDWSWTKASLSEQKKAYSSWDEYKKPGSVLIGDNPHPESAIVNNFHRDDIPGLYGNSFR